MSSRTLRAISNTGFLLLFRTFSENNLQRGRRRTCNIIIERDRQKGRERDRQTGRERETDRPVEKKRDSQVERDRYLQRNSPNKVSRMVKMKSIKRKRYNS